MAACSSSASQGMYTVKPFNDMSLGTNNLPKPSCMYSMKNYHENGIDDKLREPLECLLQRQLAVLKDLENLKKEICEILPEKDDQISVQSPCEAKVSSIAPGPVKNEFTIVVKASPDNPPLSLIVLLKMIQSNGFTCSTVNHCHSTLSSGIPSYLHNFLGGALLCTDPTADLQFRVIWKQGVLAPSLMVSITDQSPIIGETNILRYLCRLHMQQLYSKFGPLGMANIDGWLEAVTVLASLKNGKAFLESLNSHLEKHKWLVGSCVSLADVFCSIAILQTQNKSPNNVQKWIDNCRNELLGFKDVEMMLKSCS